MKMDPSTINNKLVIVPFVKTCTTKKSSEKWQVLKNINTLLDVFKSAQLNLLKLKKYKGLVADDDSGHKVNADSQITNKGLDLTKSDRSSIQIDGHGQKYIPSMNDQPR